MRTDTSAHTGDAFFEWAVQQGVVTFPGVSQESHLGYRGLFTGDIRVPPNVTVLAVPSHLLLNHRSAARSGLACVWASFLRDGCDDSCWAVLLKGDGEKDTGRKKSSWAVARRKSRLTQELVLTAFLLDRLYGSVSLQTLGSEVATWAKHCVDSPRPGSGWLDPWVETLPKFQDLTPTSLTTGPGEPCQDVLEGTLAKSMGNKKRQVWKAQFSSFHTRGLLGKLSEVMFEHAIALVATRSFGKNWNPEANSWETVMVPVVDLINMGPDVQTPAVQYWQDLRPLPEGPPDKFYFLLTSGAEVLPGKELLTSYRFGEGMTNLNVDLFAHYGFFLDEWPFEAAPLNLADMAPVGGTHVKEKLALLERSLSATEQSLSVVCDESFVATVTAALAWARVVAISADDMPWGAGWNPRERMLNTDHERRALQLLHKGVADERARHYPLYDAGWVHASMADTRGQCRLYMHHLLQRSYGEIQHFVQDALGELQQGERQLLVRMAEGGCSEQGAKLKKLWHQQTKI